MKKIFLNNSTNINNKFREIHPQATQGHQMMLLLLFFLLVGVGCNDSFVKITHPPDEHVLTFGRSDLAFDFTGIGWNNVTKEEATGQELNWSLSGGPNSISRYSLGSGKTLNSSSITPSRCGGYRYTVHLTMMVNETEYEDSIEIFLSYVC